MPKMEKLELFLDEKLNKKSPLNLSGRNRKSLAGAMWWLALAAGVLQLYLAWRLWDAWRIVDDVSRSFGTYAKDAGIEYDVSGLGFAFYLALMTLLASGVLLLLAAAGLKEMSKAGWNLAFYGLLINLAYGVVMFLSSYGDFGNLLGAAAGSLIGAFLLFQVRDQFMKSHAKKKET